MFSFLRLLFSIYLIPFVVDNMLGWKLFGALRLIKKDLDLENLGPLLETCHRTVLTAFK